MLKKTNQHLITETSEAIQGREAHRWQHDLHAHGRRTTDSFILSVHLQKLESVYKAQSMLARWKIMKLNRLALIRNQPTFRTVIFFKADLEGKDTSIIHLQRWRRANDVKRPDRYAEQVTVHLEEGRRAGKDEFCCWFTSGTLRNGFPLLSSPKGEAFIYLLFLCDANWPDLYFIIAGSRIWKPSFLHRVTSHQGCTFCMLCL